MKHKIILLLLPGILLFSPVLWSQATSFETDFSDPAGNNGTWGSIDENADPHEFLFSVANGTMTIDYNKTSWHFIQFWIKPFDITVDPYFSFTARADKETPFHITLKDGDGNTVTKEVSLTTTYQYFYFNLQNDLSTLTSTLDEIQFSLDYGDASGHIFFDDLKLGSAAKTPYTAPTIDQVTDRSVWDTLAKDTVILTGITDGGDGFGQTLTVTASSNDTTLIPTPVILYTSPQDTALLLFTPRPGQQGTATLTVTVQDNGPVENTTRMSFAVTVLAYGGTGFSDDLSNIAPEEWIAQKHGDYQFLPGNGTLTVECRKNNPWSSFYHPLGKVYDLSSAPYLNIKIKTTEPMVFQAYLGDIHGNTALRETRVLKSDNYAVASFDFSGETAVDLEKIDKLIFSFNGEAYSFYSTARFDEISGGTLAKNYAYFGSISDQRFYRNTQHCNILITDISHVSHFVITGGDSLMENILFTPVNNHLDTLQFDCKPGATGTDTVTLTAAGEPGYADYAFRFLLSVSDNAPPTIDPVRDTLCAAGERMLIPLSGIGDGNSSREQKITLTPVTDKPAVITELSATYQNPSHYGTLSFLPAAEDTALITVGVKDDGGGDDSTAVSFRVTVYASVNHAPVIQNPGPQTVYNTLDKDTIYLTGISDGDEGTQQLTIGATSSADSVISNPVTVVYAGGDTALLILSPGNGVTGKTTLTVTVSDNGGAEGNNGDMTTVLNFEVETITPPATGLVTALNPGDLTNGTWGFSSTYHPQIVDSGSFRAIKIVCKDKFYWDGYVWNFNEVDISKNPYLSMEIYSADKATAHWIWFYDNTHTRNDLVNYDKRVWVPANKWTKVFFDFSGEKDLINKENNAPIDASRIIYVLFNMHDADFSWPPPPDYNGTFYIRNIRLGSRAEIPARTPACSMDAVSRQTVFVNTGHHEITLTGITDGAGSPANVQITATSSDKNIIPDPAVGAPSSGGTALLSYEAGSLTGKAVITLTLSAPQSEPYTLTFPIDVVSKDVSQAAMITIDRKEQHQTITGLGTMENRKEWISLFAGDMGASAVRIGILDNQIEPVNDNNDPEVLDMDHLNYNAFDWEYYRALKDSGIKIFFITVWSPPAWMKENLSLNWYKASAESSTDRAKNKLEPYYYEEFAENMVATVRMFKEKADIDIYAIGLQNEPVFNEPYPSAILDPDHFAKLIAVVGKRFEKEGIHTKILMPEQVFSQFVNPMSLYIDVLQQNTDANKYCDIIATHGYATDGIAPGQPDYSQWEKMWNNAQQEPYPKQLWMSETSPLYTGWNSALSFAGALHGALWAGNISLWTNYAFEGVQLIQGDPTSTFYISKQYFTFIRPGAIRVGSQVNNNNLLVTAFEHPQDHTFTIEIINKWNDPVSAYLSGSNLPGGYQVYRSSQYENMVRCDSAGHDLFLLPPKSVTTLYATYNSPLTIDQVPNQLIPMNAPVQTVSLTGISDGSGGTSSLSLTAETSDTSLIRDLTVSSVNTDGTAVLNYTPAPGKTGTARVRLILFNDTAQREVIFYVTIQDLSLSPENVTEALKIYPNPVTERGTLFIEIPGKNTNTLTINNVSGSAVLKKTVSPGTTVAVNAATLGQGIFVITLRGDHEMYKSKVVVR